MMIISKQKADDYAIEYKCKINNLICKNFKESKKTILEYEALDFIIKKCELINEDLSLNVEKIGEFLIFPVCELEKKYDWVHEYIVSIQFCYEYTQFVKYCKWKNNQSKDKKDLKPKDIREQYLQIAGFMDVIEKYQCDVGEIINSSVKFDNLIKIIKEKLDKINELIEIIFSYDSMSDEIRNDIKKIYNVEVCPYCNRQFISWWEEDEDTRVTSDLDHILPKSLFPLFSLNLYNLIPVCLICNRYIKLNRYMPIWNPFEKGFDDYVKFQIDKYNSVEAMIGSDTDFEIKLQKTKNLEAEQEEKIDATIWFFKFNKLYNNHKENVRSLIRKKYIYSLDVLKELNQLLQGTQNISEQEMELLLYGVMKCDNELQNKILGKLTYDIIWE